MIYSKTIVITDSVITYPWLWRRVEWRREHNDQNQHNLASGKAAKRRLRVQPQQHQPDADSDI